MKSITLFALALAVLSCSSVVEEEFKSNDIVVKRIMEAISGSLLMIDTVEYKLEGDSIKGSARFVAKKHHLIFASSPDDKYDKFLTDFRPVNKIIVAERYFWLDKGGKLEVDFRLGALETMDGLLLTGRTLIYNGKVSGGDSEKIYDTHFAELSLEYNKSPRQIMTSDIDENVVKRRNEVNKAYNFLLENLPGVWEENNNRWDKICLIEENKVATVSESSHLHLWSFSKEDYGSQLILKYIAYSEGRKKMIIVCVDLYGIVAKTQFSNYWYRRHSFKKVGDEQDAREIIAKQR